MHTMYNEVAVPNPTSGADKMKCLFHNEALARYAP
jgi:hypothetical protein